MARDCIVYVGNLPCDIREGEIEDVFHKYGRIRHIDIKVGCVSMVTRNMLVSGHAVCARYANQGYLHGHPQQADSLF